MCPAVPRTRARGRIGADKRSYTQDEKGEHDCEGRARWEDGDVGTKRKVEQAKIVLKQAYR
jgi:hypothetical protein